MALALGIRRDTDEYVRVEHAGEAIRIGIHTGHSVGKDILIMMADDGSREAPPESWRFVRSTAVKKT